MKNKRIFKTFSALCLAVVMAVGFTVPAFAQGHRPVSGGGRHQRRQRSGRGNRGTARP